MSKKLDFGKLNNKPKIRKTASAIDTEKAVQKIHKPEYSKERTKRVTIDFPHSLYIEIKKKVLEEEITLRDYVISLTTKDLNS